MDNEKNELSAEELIKRLMANLNDEGDGKSKEDAIEQMTIDNMSEEGSNDASELENADGSIHAIYHFKVKSRRGTIDQNKETDPDFASAAASTASLYNKDESEAGDSADLDDIEKSISNAEKYVSDMEERAATGDFANASAPSEDDEDEEDEDDEDEDDEDDEFAPEDGDIKIDDDNNAFEESDEEEYFDESASDESNAEVIEENIGQDKFGELADLASAAILGENGESQEEKTGEKKKESNIDDLDENDINLMMIFNRDEELRKKLGDDELERIMRSMEDDRQMDVSDRSKEYTSPDQNAEFQTDFTKRFKKNTFRVVVAAIFFLFVLVVELMYMGGKRPIAYGDDLLYVLIGIQITLICGALAFKEFIHGFRSLFSGRPDPNTAFSISAVFTLIFEIAVIAQGDKISLYNMFNIPLSFSTLLCIIGSRLDLQRDMRAFKIISTRKPKYAIANIPESNSTLEKETFDKYIDESNTSGILGVSRGEFITRFSARSSRVGNNKAVIGMIIPIPVIAAIVFFAIGYFSSTNGSLGLVKGLESAEAAIMMAMPISIFIGYSFPFWCASKSAFKNGSAIIGENSLDEYSKASVVTFNDRDVFPAKGVKVRSMRLFGTNRIDHVLYRTASVFSKLGGPLCDVFTVATKDLGHSEDVDIIEIGEGGVEAAVDGEKVILGGADYLKANGYSPAIEADDREAEYSGQLCIMYVAIGDEIAAKMYIEYRMDPEFADVMRSLCRSGVCLGIRTFDPNLNNTMLDRRIKLSKYPVRVLRCAQGCEMSMVEETIDSGIVSKKSPKHLLKTLTLCDRVLQVTKTNVAVKIISIILGILIVGLVAFLGDITKLSSLWVLLYQIFWMIPMVVISILFI